MHGRYLTTEPSKLVFTRGKYGKPQLQIPIPGSTLSRRLQFNLSHTGSLIGVYNMHVDLSA